MLEFTDFLWICVGIWGLYADYSRSVGGHICEMFCLTYIFSNVESKCRLYYSCSGTYMFEGWDICSGAYANNVKCMYTSAYGHIVDCGEIIWGIYTDTIV